MRVVALGSTDSICEDVDIERQFSFGSYSIATSYSPLADETRVERACWSLNKKVLAVSVVSAVIFAGFTVATFQVDRDFAFIAGPFGGVSLITGCMYFLCRD